MSRGMPKGHKYTADQRAKMSVSAIKRHAKKPYTDEQRKLIGERTRQRWADPERRARWVASIRAKSGRKQEFTPEQQIEKNREIMRRLRARRKAEGMPTRWQKAHGEEFRANAPERKSGMRHEAGRKSAVTRKKNKAAKAEETRSKVAALIAAAKPILDRVGVKMAKREPQHQPDNYGIIRKERPL